MLPIPKTEINLVQDLKAKLPTAFSFLYDSYSPAMFGVLLRMVKDHQQAEDLLQDAFIKVWSNIHNYDASQGRLFTWLLTITKRLALDELRTRKVRAIATTYIYERSDGLTSPTLSEGMLNQSITSSLEPKYRQVVDLLYFRDYTNQEVADELQIPLGTVKTRYRMALRQLKQSFSHDIRHYRMGSS
ncbi:sigma-70 family RNA polymerase sigma factor [Spirosoma sp. HMF4905]|uniref:RNA polymerase sigma factor n=1 Tax=Spirosoma arboris TaxID=2682092 RepID=A0A7K1S8P2_9BACT|nr:sigma-70 family RNA polymerase sigma factor [Spirosoma arboris]MVM30157.1 sigma-70 family RNA polymerase sigma factor [Spirosoma arboris]